MNIQLERRLAEFVDRTEEVERFCRMLDSDEKHIMVVWGEHGMGKSTLRLRMVHECAQRKLRKAEVECGGTRTTGYTAIMRKIRDDLGVQHFNLFNDYVSYLTEPGYQPKIALNITIQGVGNIAVAQGAQISGGSSVGDIAGVVFKDNMFVLPRTDIAVPEEERMFRLTDHFIEGVNTASKEGVLVVFLDALETMAPETKRWLWEELLKAVCEGRLTGIKFVLYGNDSPKLDRDWRMFIEEAELRPLAIEHIEAYLEKRGVEEAVRNVLAVGLLGNTKGRISDIATWVDGFLLQRQQMARK